MDNGWESSAQAWIDSMGERGERGDWGRQHVLDPVMMERVRRGKFANALDVGCGEGRFCRMLKAAGVRATGIDPTAPFVELARQRDPGGDYRLGRAEQLEFPDASFDLAVTYITLIDIPDFRAAIREMARVLRPGGSLMIHIPLYQFPNENGPWGPLWQRTHAFTRTVSNIKADLARRRGSKLMRGTPYSLEGLRKFLLDLGLNRVE